MRRIHQDSIAKNAISSNSFRRHRIRAGRRAINLAKKNGVKYVTAAPTRFAPAWVPVWLFQNIDRRKFHSSTFAHLRQWFFPAIVSDAKADPKFRAGVLIADCFELLSLVVANFSLPDQIYTLMTNQSADRKAKQYLGEDTVTARLFLRRPDRHIPGLQTTGSSLAPPPCESTEQNKILRQPEQIWPSMTIAVH